LEGSITLSPGLCLSRGRPGCSLWEVKHQLNTNALPQLPFPFLFFPFFGRIREIGSTG